MVRKRSASVVLEAATSRAAAGPVISVGSVKGSVVKVSPSPRASKSAVLRSAGASVDSEPSPVCK
jgi:hypothetical protein